MHDNDHDNLSVNNGGLQQRGHTPRTIAIQVSPYNDTDERDMNTNDATISSWSAKHKYYWLLIALLAVLLIIEFVTDTSHQSAATQLLQSSEQAQVQQRMQIAQLQRNAAVREKQLRASDAELQTAHHRLHTYTMLIDQLRSSADREFQHAVRLLNTSTGHHLNASSYEQLVGLLVDDNSEWKVAKVESVIRVNSDEQLDSDRADDYVDSNNKLVDSSDNVYVLSSGSDTSRQTIDARLLFDLGAIICCSALGGWVAVLLYQPALIGYLVAGIVIGPGGFSVVSELIQIETFAQLGATFLLFALGIEFNVNQLRRVKYIALVGGSAQILMCAGVGVVVGISFLQLQPAAGAFIGCVLAMSSTTVVLSTLEAQKQTLTQTGSVIIALLIAQDIALSFILSFTSLSGVGSEMIAFAVGRLLIKFAAMAVVMLVCSLMWPTVLRLLISSGSNELFLVGLVGMCVFLTEVSDRVISSGAVGAFVAGVLISSSPYASSDSTHRAAQQFEPVRHMFAALFFAAIGLLINPRFLFENSVSIIAIVLCTHVVKTCVVALICRVFRCDIRTCISVGVWLSQVGEFAFVLANTGLRTGLITKHTYLLLLSTTMCSLIMTPALLSLTSRLLQPVS